MSDRAMTPVNPKHPLMQAWLQYEQTESYKTARTWITSQSDNTILEGSLWAAFMQGWIAHEWKAKQLLDAAVKLCAFTKTHEFPREGTEDFYELTQFIDALDMEVRKALVEEKGTG